MAVVGCCCCGEGTCHLTLVAKLTAPEDGRAGKNYGVACVVASLHCEEATSLLCSLPALPLPHRRRRRPHHSCS